MKKIFSKKYKDIIPGGLADDIPNSNFDKDKLKEGIEIELEHTSDKNIAEEIAEEIAKDHLTEDKNYYKLKILEKEALLNEKEINTLNNNMLKVIDQFESGPFLLYLIESDTSIYPKELKYQLAIQSEGLSATSISDQFSKNTIFNAVKGINSLKPLKNKIKEWLDKYKMLGVSSVNKNKSTKWFNILRLLGFNVNSKNFQFLGQNIEYIIIT